jgi:hypothetical protein
MKRTATALAAVVCLIGGMAALAPVSTFAASGASTDVPGPVPGYVISEAYARATARTLYARAWPMTNVYNRLVAARQVPKPGLNQGIVPLAPPWKPDDIEKLG